MEEVVQSDIESLSKGCQAALAAKDKELYAFFSLAADYVNEVERLTDIKAFEARLREAAMKDCEGMRQASAEVVKFLNDAVTKLAKMTELPQNMKAAIGEANRLCEEMEKNNHATIEGIFKANDPLWAICGTGFGEGYTWGSRVPSMFKDKDDFPEVQELLGVEWQDSYLDEGKQVVASSLPQKLVHRFNEEVKKKDRVAEVRAWYAWEKLKFLRDAWEEKNTDYREEIDIIRHRPEEKDKLKTLLPVPYSRYLENLNRDLVRFLKEQPTQGKAAPKPSTPAAAPSQSNGIIPYDCWNEGKKLWVCVRGENNKEVKLEFRGIRANFLQELIDAGGDGISDADMADALDENDDDFEATMANAYGLRCEGINTRFGKQKIFGFIVRDDNSSKISELYKRIRK